MYCLLNKIIVRNPFFPFNILEKSLKDRMFMYEIIGSPIFKSAIYLSSRDLFLQLEKYLQGEMDLSRLDKFFISITKYLSRMSTRSTPFGLFSSVSISELSIQNQFRLKILNDFYYAIRLDMSLLYNISRELLKDDHLRYKLRYKKNSTIYKIGGKYRYIETELKFDRRIYDIVEISSNKYLRQIVKKTHEYISLNELCLCLLDYDSSLSYENVWEYLLQLVDSHFLVSEFEPIVQGKDYLSYLTDFLNGCDSFSGLASLLPFVLDKFSNRINISYDTNLCKILTDIKDQIDSVVGEIECKTPFQLDLFRQGERVDIPKNIILQIQRVFILLNRMIPLSKNPELDYFVKCYVERYDQEERPILEVLDPSIGIGFPAYQTPLHDDELLKGLVLPIKEVNVGFGRNIIHNGFLYEKLQNFSIEKGIEFLITDLDIGNNDVFWEDLPVTMYSMCEILKNPNTDDIVVLLKGLGGSSASNLMGRFAYESKNIKCFINEIHSLESEHYRDYILAEISHLPDAKTGNVIMRPLMRDYEIPYLSNSIRDDNSVIPLSDIFISIRNGEIKLRSKRMNKYIITRMTTAHNYSNKSTPIYKFLCEIQNQNMRKGLFFSWGDLEDKLLFFPRVRYKNVILSPAKWYLSDSEVNFLICDTKESELLSNVEIIRKKRFIPRYVYIVKSDNKLFIDLENTLSIKLFVDELKKKKSKIVLEEFFFPYGYEEEKECYLNECILSFYRK